MKNANVSNYEVKEHTLGENNNARPLKGNVIVKEGDILKVFPNVLDSQPFIFDADDKEKLLEHTISRNTKGYAVAYDRKSGKQIYLHRLIMDMLDKPSTDFIDHIDGNKNNNCKSNLRICHREDAPNQNNVLYTFLGGQKVKRYRTPDDKFVIGYTDGIIPYIEYEYNNYADLIKHYTALFEQGFERTTKYKLLESKLECLERIRDSKSKKITKDLKAQLKELEKLIANVNLAYAQVQLQLAKGIAIKGLINVNGKIMVACDTTKTPKELYESGVTPSVLYLGNFHDKEQAGNHTFKPNGEEIY